MSSTIETGYGRAAVDRTGYDEAAAGSPPVIRVCHIVSTFTPRIGGVQKATLSLCAQLARRGVELTVLTRRLPGLAAREQIDGIRIHRVGVPLMNRIGALSFALAALWSLATRLRRYRVLHVQNIDAPLIVGLVAKLLPGRRVVATIHGESKVEAKRSSVLGRLRLEWMRRADRFTALTPPMESSLRAVGVPSERIERIPNGIDTSEFRVATDDERRRARRELGLPRDVVVGLSVGRLVPLKRVDLLLEAWSRLGDRDAVLVVVGDGSEREKLERIAGGAGGPQVRFLGSRSDIRTCFQAADLFILPSASEGLPMSLLEAMAAGLAVVATALPGITGMARHERDALLVPPNDAAGLRTAIERLLDSPDLRAELGEEARATILRECDLNGVTDAHVALYRSLTRSGTRDRPDTITNVHDNSDLHRR